MKTRILILVMVFVGLFANAQKLSRSKVQITDLKNAEVLKTDVKGNVVAGSLDAIRDEIAKKINAEDVTEMQKAFLKKIDKAIADISTNKESIKNFVRILNENKHKLENLGISDIANLQSEITRLENLIANTGKVKTVNGIEPDSKSNITLPQTDINDYLLAPITTNEKSFGQSKVIDVPITFINTNDKYEYYNTIIQKNNTLTKTFYAYSKEPLTLYYTKKSGDDYLVEKSNIVVNGETDITDYLNKLREYKIIQGDSEFEKYAGLIYKKGEGNTLKVYIKGEEVKSSLDEVILNSKRMVKSVNYNYPDIYGNINIPVTGATKEYVDAKFEELKALINSKH